MNVYIVCGSTGEWSDRTEWLVFAFKSEAEAIAHVNACKDTLQRFDQRNRGYQRQEGERVALEEAMLPLDPNFYEDYTGTHYFIRQVELR